MTIFHAAIDRPRKCQTASLHAGGLTGSFRLLSKSVPVAIVPRSTSPPRQVFGPSHHLYSTPICQRPRAALNKRARTRSALI